MILLSFDIEEFDLPTEYGLAISWEEQLRVSREGSGHILNVLARHGVRATFFCTARFAEADVGPVGHVLSHAAHDARCRRGAPAGRLPL